MATTATQASVERLRRGYAAFSAGDMATVRELLAPDTVWHILGHSALAGDYKGVDAVFGFFGQLMQRSEGSYKIDVHDILANDQHGVVLTNEHGDKNGTKFESHGVHVVHFDSEGRVKEFWGFLGDQAAADAFFG